MDLLEVGLGQLHHEAGPGQTGDVQRRLDELGEVAGVELAGGHVDVHPGRLLTEQRDPGHGEPAGLLDHPLSQGGHQAGALGEVEPLRRQQQTVFGVLPPQERLDGGDPPVGQVDDGLELQHELPALQCAPQLAPKLEGPHRRRLQVAGVERVTLLAGPLGGLHRGVGVGEQLTRLLARPPEGDADAAGQDQGLGVDPHRRAHGCQDPGGDALRLLGARQAGAEHTELVLAEARDRVARAGGGLEPAGYRHQGGVACALPSAVVDRREVVHVDAEQAQVVLPSAAGGEGLVEPVEQQAAVGQARQGVVEAGPGGVLLGAAPRRRVIQLDRYQDAVAIAGQAAGRHRNPARLLLLTLDLVRPGQGQVTAPRCRCAGGDSAETGAERDAVLGVDQAAEQRTDPGLWRAEQGHRGGIDVNDDQGVPDRSQLHQPWHRVRARGRPHVVGAAPDAGAKKAAQHAGGGQQSGTGR